MNEEDARSLMDGCAGWGVEYKINKCFETKFAVCYTSMYTFVLGDYLNG